MEGVVASSDGVAVCYEVHGSGTPALVFVQRFRQARGLERLQLRWLALGAALAALTFAIAMTALVVEETDSWIFRATLGISVTVLPLATGAAILRYRLYDIDRIVSRTLATRS